MCPDDAVDGTGSIDGRSVFATGHAGSRSPARNMARVGSGPGLPAMRDEGPVLRISSFRCIRPEPHPAGKLHMPGGCTHGDGSAVEGRTIRGRRQHRPVERREGGIGQEVVVPCTGGPSPGRLRTDLPFGGAGPVPGVLSLRSSPPGALGVPFSLVVVRLRRPDPISGTAGVPTMSAGRGVPSSHGAARSMCADIDSRQARASGCRLADGVGGVAAIRERWTPSFALGWWRRRPVRRWRGNDCLVPIPPPCYQRLP